MNDKTRLSYVLDIVPVAGLDDLVRDGIQCISSVDQVSLIFVEKAGWSLA